MCKNLRKLYCGEFRRQLSGENDWDDKPSRPQTPPFPGDTLDILADDFDENDSFENAPTGPLSDDFGPIVSKTLAPNRNPTVDDRSMPEIDSFGDSQNTAAPWKTCQNIRMCTKFPTPFPTKIQTNSPTNIPTVRPSNAPTDAVTLDPTKAPTASPTDEVIVATPTPTLTTATPTEKQDDAIGAMPEMDTTVEDCEQQGFCFSQSTKWCVPCDATRISEKRVSHIFRKSKTRPARNPCKLNSNPCRNIEVCSFRKKRRVYTYACLSNENQAEEYHASFASLGTVSGAIGATAVVATGAVAIATMTAATTAASAGVGIGAVTAGSSAATEAVTSTAAASSSGGAASSSTTNIGDVVAFAQTLVVAAQMNLPYEPKEFFDFSSSFSWANLNFGVSSLFSTNSGSIPGSTRRRRLSPSELSGMEKYCAVLDIEPEYFALDVIVAFLLVTAAIMGTMAIGRALLWRIGRWRQAKLNGVRGWFTSKITPGRECRLREKLSFSHMTVRVAYYGFYPVLLACLFQIVFVRSIQEIDTRMPMARISMYIAIFVMTTYVGGMLLLAYVSWQQHSGGKASEKPSLARASTISQRAISYVGPPLAAIEKDYRKGAEMFWTAKLMRSLMTAVTIAAVADPRPSQPSIVLGIALAYLFFSLWVKPYGNPISNGAIAVYGLFSCINSALFVIYGSGTNEAPFSRSTLRTIANVQIATNLLMLVALMFVVLGRASGTKTCADFKAWILLERYYPKVPGYYGKVHGEQKLDEKDDGSSSTSSTVEDSRVLKEGAQIEIAIDKAPPSLVDVTQVNIA